LLSDCDVLDSSDWFSRASFWTGLTGKSAALSPIGFSELTTTVLLLSLMPSDALAASPSFDGLGSML
jgi:hypothetical protein